MRVPLALVLTAAILVPGCKSNPADVISGGIVDAIAGVDSLLGPGNLPSVHLGKLRSVHEPSSWRLRADLPGALDAGREALRELGQSDFSTWRDAGLVTQVVSSCATDHGASLMRVEALDTLAQLALWTFPADTPPGFPAREEDVIDALKVVRDAGGRVDDDPVFTARVMMAVRQLGAYRFDGGEPLGAKLPLVVAARRTEGRLRNARGVLLAFTGSTLEGFQGDAEIRDSMDRAYISLSASVIRSTLVTALTGDDSEIVRANAARHLHSLVVPSALPELARSIRGDPSSSVRRAAASALGAYPPESAVPVLIDALYDDMPDVRGAAARALQAATGESYGDDRGSWKRWWTGRSGAASPESTQ